MKPYGIPLKDRRPMCDWGSDRYNSRGCFNTCTCPSCKNNKYKIRSKTVRRPTGKLTVKNAMRSAKKKIRQQNKQWQNF